MAADERFEVAGDAMEGVLHDDEPPELLRRAHSARSSQLFAEPPVLTPESLTGEREDELMPVCCTCHACVMRRPTIRARSV